jgi:hypothetical protein
MYTMPEALRSALASCDIVSTKFADAVFSPAERAATRAFANVWIRGP